MTAQIKSAAELGQTIREFRKNRGYTLEQIAGICNVSMRFLSELERGKETASIGKIFKVLNKIGLDLFIETRLMTQGSCRHE